MLRTETAESYATTAVDAADATVPVVPAPAAAPEELVVQGASPLTAADLPRLSNEDVANLPKALLLNIPVADLATVPVEKLNHLPAEVLEKLPLERLATLNLHAQARIIVLALSTLTYEDFHLVTEESYFFKEEFKKLTQETLTTETRAFLTDLFERVTQDINSILFPAYLKNMVLRYIQNDRINAAADRAFPGRETINVSDGIVNPLLERYVDGTLQLIHFRPFALEVISLYRSDVLSRLESKSDVNRDAATNLELAKKLDRQIMEVRRALREHQTIPFKTHLFTKNALEASVNLAQEMDAALSRMLVERAEAFKKLKADSQDRRTSLRARGEFLQQFSLEFNAFCDKYAKKQQEIFKAHHLTQKGSKVFADAEAEVSSEVDRSLESIFRAPDSSSASSSLSSAGTATPTRIRSASKGVKEGEHANDKIVAIEGLIITLETHGALSEEDQIIKLAERLQDILTEEKQMADKRRPPSRTRGTSTSSDDSSVPKPSSSKTVLTRLGEEKRTGTPSTPPSSATPEFSAVTVDGSLSFPPGFNSSTNTLVRSESVARSRPQISAMASAAALPPLHRRNMGEDGGVGPRTRSRSQPRHHISRSGLFTTESLITGGVIADGSVGSAAPAAPIGDSYLVAHEGSAAASSSSSSESSKKKHQTTPVSSLTPTKRG